MQPLTDGVELSSGPRGPLGGLLLLSTSAATLLTSGLAIALSRSCIVRCEGADWCSPQYSCRYSIVSLVLGSLIALTTVASLAAFLRSGAPRSLVTAGESGFGALPLILLGLWLALSQPCHYPNCDYRGIFRPRPGVCTMDVVPAVCGTSAWRVAFGVLVVLGGLLLANGFRRRRSWPGARHAT